MPLMLLVLCINYYNYNIVTYLYYNKKHVPINGRHCSVLLWRCVTVRVVRGVGRKCSGGGRGVRMNEGGRESDEGMSECERWVGGCV